MPFPQDMVLVRLRFTAGLASPVEVQDTGFWCRVQGADGVTYDWQDAVNLIAARVRDTWKAAMTASYFSSSIKGSRVIAYHYDQAHQEVLHRGEAGFVAASAWAGSGGVLPLENSLVLSLYGYDPALYAPDRKYKRGRMYLPTPAGGNFDGDGRLTTARQIEMVDASAAWWAALQAAIPFAGGQSFSIQPVVNSPTSSSVTDAKWLRLGKVVDTQRRRRNALAEDYVTIKVE